MVDFLKDKLTGSLNPLIYTVKELNEHENVLWREKERVVRPSWVEVGQEERS